MKNTLLAFSALLASVSAFAAPSVDLSAESSVTVNAKLHSTGFMSTVKDYSGTHTTFVKDFKFASSRTHAWAEADMNQRVVDLQHVFPLQHRDPSDDANYFFAATDRKITYATSSSYCGIDVMYRLGVSPESPGYNFTTRVPTNFTAVAAAMSHIVGHYASNSKISRWEIWNAPDDWERNWYQAGQTPAQLKTKFAQFYATCLKKIKTDHPSAKVGGPALSKWDPDYMGAILSACETEGVVPDFISYQCYTNDVDALLAQPAQIRAWLDARGSQYANTEIILSAWHYIPGRTGTFDNLDMDKIADASFGTDGTMTATAAAFNLAVLGGLQSTPLARAYHGMTALRSQFSPYHWSSVNSSVPHCAANVFRMFGEKLSTYSKVLPVSGNTAAVHAYAAVNSDGSKGILAVSNYKGSAGNIAISIPGGKRPENITMAVADDTHNNVSASNVSYANGTITIASAPRSAAYLLSFDIVDADAKYQNSWTTTPALSKTTWEVGQAAATVTDGVPAHGTATKKLNGAAFTAMPTAAGSYQLTWSVPEDDDYYGLTKTISFTITEPIPVGSVFYLQESDASGTSTGFNTPAKWASLPNGGTPAAAISSDYKYNVNGKRLRTANNSTSQTFAGRLILDGSAIPAPALDPDLTDTGYGTLTFNGSENAVMNLTIGGIEVEQGGFIFGNSVDVTVNSPMTINGTLGLQVGGTGTRKVRFSGAVTGGSATAIRFISGGTEGQIAAFDLAGDCSGYAGTIQDDGNVRTFTIKLSGSYGGTITSLPANTAAVLVNYGGLDAAKGLPVATTAVPAVLKTKLTLYSSTQNFAAANLPLLTFPAGTTVNAADFTVKHATSADGTATAFTNLAAIDGANGTKILVANRQASARTQIPIPSAVTGLVYTGDVQYGVPEGAGYTLSGSTGSALAGNYTATATLVDTATTEWTDGTTAPKSISWSIAQAANTWTTPAALSKTSWKAGEAAATVTHPVAAFGSVTKTLDGAAWNGTTMPTAVGSHTIVWTVAGTANYTGLSTSKTFTISQADAAVNSWSTPASISKSSWTYGSTAGTVTAPVAAYGAATMTRTLNGAAWNGTMPTAVGSYEIVWSVAGTDDYTELQTNVSFTIGKATPTFGGTLSIAGWTQGASANSPSGLSASFGTIVYKYSTSQNGTYSTTVPTAAGTYWVRGEVAASANWNAASSAAVSFTIAPAAGATYYLAATDAENGSSMVSGPWSTNPSATSASTHTVDAANDYVVASGKRLRCTTTTATDTFAGKTLTLRGELGTQMSNSITSNRDKTLFFTQLIADGGKIVYNGSIETAPTLYRIAGSVLMSGSLGIQIGGTFPRALEISANMVGTGAIDFVGTATTEGANLYASEFILSGDDSAYTGTIRNSTDASNFIRPYIIRVTGAFGGTITSLPPTLTNLVFNYSGLDSAKGIRVATTTIPAPLKTKLTLFSATQNFAAADLPLITFPAGTTVNAADFTVKHAASANGAATAFTDLAVIDGTDGTKVLVANHGAEPPIVKPTPTISGTLVMNGWTEGETANSPSGLSSDYGTVVYKYSTSQNGTYTTTKPSAAGTYWVRGEVAASEDWNAAVSAVVSFTIASSAAGTTYYLQASDAQNSSSALNTLSKWYSQPSGGGSHPASISATDDFNVNGCRLRTLQGVATQTFGGKSLILTGGTLANDSVTGAGCLSLDGTDDTSLDLTFNKIVVNNGGLVFANTLTATIHAPIEITNTFGLQLGGMGTRSLNLAGPVTGAATSSMTIVAGGTKDHDCFFELSGDCSGYAGTIADRGNVRTMTIKLTGNYGGTITSLPQYTSAVVVHYSGLDTTKGVRVATTTIPAPLKTKLTLFSATQDFSAANLPLITFPAGTAVNAADFTVKHATSADGTAVAFEDLTVRTNSDGTKTLLANDASIANLPSVPGYNRVPTADVFQYAKTDRPIVYPAIPVLSGTPMVNQRITHDGVTVNVPVHYTATLDGKVVSLALNQNAAARFVADAAGQAFSVADSVVTFTGTRFTPGLYYAIDSSATVDGEYEAPTDPADWHLALSATEIEGGLTAEMSGSSRFYRIIVRDTLDDLAGAITCPIAGYHLVWNDEFDTGTDLNEDDWTYCLWDKGTSNNELQYYRKGSVAGGRTTEVRDGTLRINCFKGTDNKVYSARVYAKRYTGWEYGYFEARIKLPKGRGTWPAFWMMPLRNGGQWPKYGEIDIMEEVGYHANYVSSSLHALGHYFKVGNQITEEYFVEGAEDDFHTYAMEWTADYIQFYYDGIPRLRYEDTGKGLDDWPYFTEFYLILNLAWGGDWGGHNGVDESKLPATMEVDYVRVFQK